MKRALVGLILLAACLNTSPGNGEKIGQVVRLTKVGMFCKTWEGQLIRGGMTNGSGSFGTKPFDFTVESDSMAGLVQHYMDTQTEVKITWRTEGVFSPCRTESLGDFLTSIAPLHTP